MVRFVAVRSTYLCMEELWSSAQTIAGGETGRAHFVSRDETCIEAPILWTTFKAQ
jgi:hypothetical protein